MTHSLILDQATLDLIFPVESESESEELNHINSIESELESQGFRIEVGDEL